MSRASRSVERSAAAHSFARAVSKKLDSIRGGTPPRHCNCRGGHCRQLYCVCLKNGRACEPGICQCIGCLNDDRPEAESARAAQKLLLESAVRKGCNCKRNYCRKNYCICHSKGIHCDVSICHCQDCYNYPEAPPVPPSADDSVKDMDKRRRGGRSEKRSSVISRAEDA